MATYALPMAEARAEGSNNKKDAAAVLSVVASARPIFKRPMLRNNREERTFFIEFLLVRKR
jgi:hypothetical protein